MKRLVTATLALLVTGVLLVGLGVPSSTAQPAGPRPRLTVGVAGHTKSYLPLYLARERTAAQEDLDLELVLFDGGSRAAMALASGSVDVALASLDTLVSAASSGQPLRAFYAGFNQADMGWYAAPGVRTWEALRGRRLAVSAPGSLTDFLSRYVLRKRGLEAEVHLVAAGGPSTRWQALRAGRVDAAVLQAPFTWEAEAHGFARLGSQVTEIGAEWPTNVMFTRTDVIAQREPALRALLRAHVRALRLARADRDLAVGALGRWLKFSAADAARAYDETIGGFDERGRLPAAAMPVFWEAALGAREIGAGWSEDRILDRRFIDTFESWAPR